MLLTKEQLEARLNSDKNIVSASPSPEIEVIKWKGSGGGRNAGTKDLTHEERVAISVVSQTVGNSVAAETFGVSPSHASTLAHGRNFVSVDGSSRLIQDDKLIADTKSVVAKVKETVEERAAGKLLEALGFIDTEKLMNANAKDLANISANLSRVVSTINGNSKTDSSGVKVNVTVYQPKPAREEHFDCIEVSASA